MKKRIALFLAIALVAAGITGCSDSSAKAEPETEAAKTEAVQAATTAAATAAAAAESEEKTGLSELGELPIVKDGSKTLTIGLMQNSLTEDYETNEYASQVDLSQIQDAEVLAQMIGSADLIKFSLIVVSTVPILVAYPFVQRFFEKGVMIGSVKG